MAAKSGQTLDVKKDLMRQSAPAGVVDIARLCKQLQGSGSAELATQMIRKPEQQDINWSNRA